ncbi:hypothetical protein F5884DRAFT_873409 [Xylogone sp. PMI_703]|nr:hypothetical protein F5884DRAFT_873409 [Xylogone sp. PMI_703]
MLDQLPQEIYGLIVDQLSERKDLAQLCCVSKTLYELTIPKLYHTLSISPEAEEILACINIGPFIAGDVAGRLRHVKHLQIVAPFHSNLEERCVHFDDSRDSENESEWDDPEYYPESRIIDLALSMWDIFRHLKDESLKSFSWHLGTCIPEDILGSEGYLPTKQTSLEAISLITGSGCFEEEDLSDPIDLTKFHSLKRISWIGVRTAAQFRIIRTAIRTNSQILTHLRVGYCDQPVHALNAEGQLVSLTLADGPDDDVPDDDGDEDPDEINFFAYKCLGWRPPPKQKLTVPKLTSLILEYMPLGPTTLDLVHDLNIQNLSHLCLRHCDGMNLFLEAIDISDQQLKLSSLEYCTGSRDSEFRSVNILENILLKTPSLTDLFLSLPAPGAAYTGDFWRKISARKIPLRRFVYHQRTLNLDYTSGLFEEDQDARDMSLSPGHVHEMANSGEKHPLASFDIECLGVCSAPLLTRLLLHPPSATKSLKILHIRRTGLDIVTKEEDRIEYEIGFPEFGNSDDDIDEDESDHDDEDEDDEDEEDPEADEEVQENEEADGHNHVENNNDTNQANDTETNPAASPLPDPTGMAHFHIYFSHSTPPSSSASSSHDDSDIGFNPDLSNEMNEFLSFAAWAFGPDGIPSLKILAYGDFSYDGRYAAKNMLLGRKKWDFPKPKIGASAAEGEEVEIVELPFCLVEEGDQWMKDMVAENMDFLSACPMEPIVNRFDM